MPSWRPLHRLAAALGGGGVALCHPSSEQSSSSPASACPMFKKAASTPSTSSCPVKRGRPSPGEAEELNPLNMMPAPNQEAAEGQSVELSTDRVESTIPKGDGGTWVYPSSQMFFNALQRKGKSAEGQEQAMDAVVAIHNNMNELTWQKVLEWEALHCDECKEERKLLRFVGRPDELSTKARLNYYLGLAPRPFDRHDWTVDRCGIEVRYIIDYYDVPEAHGKERLPALTDGPEAVPSIRVDVRPALDSPTAALDRLTAFSRTAKSAITAAIASSPAPAPPTAPPVASTPTTIPSAEQRLSLPYVNLVRQRCADRMADLQRCSNEQEFSVANIALTMCIAEQVCSAEADAFKACGGKSGEEVETHYEKVKECVSKWGSEAARANQ